MGVEYESGINPPMFSLDNNGGQSLSNLSPPCVVCHVSTRSIQIMIPAMVNCPTGWTKEYGGYVVSQSQAQTRTEFVCLDKVPEAVAGSGGSVDGAVFYVVEAQCGISLACPPYVNGYEISCVVCTK